ncbi:ice-binding family protein [Promicromonospora sp. Populi]|uniref:ice-binding family protein n=1 Tax=Promicromonospora sp. Populi TaxID=3239420 RepID=UPI0034E265B1
MPDTAHRGRGLTRAHGPATVLLVLLALVGSVATGTAPASAYWSASGSGAATATTSTLSAPVDVTVPVTSSGEIPVSWTQGDGGVQPAGDYVARSDGDTTVPACESSPTSLVAEDSCTDADVPVGEHTYVVTAVYASWTALSAPSATVAVTAPALLGAARSYSVLAATAVVSTGVTTVSGDLGVSPGTTITGIDPSRVGGDIHAGDGHAAAAHAALVDAYEDLAARPADGELVGDLGGRTLTPGIYHSTAAMAVTGTLTLDANGDADAVFVLQTSAAFNTAAASSVTLIDGAQASNVYWVVAGAAGTGANSFLSGSIVAQGAITLGASTALIGRALSLGAVTLASNSIRFTDALPPEVNPPPVVTPAPLARWAPTDSETYDEATVTP